jgi:hypothetical protein
LLAWYLGNRLGAQFLTREDIEPASLEAWAKQPHIAAQIEGFHYINNLASQCIHTANYIDAQRAVGEELRTASTSRERLRAINAFIRLSSSAHRRAADPHVRKDQHRSAPDAAPRDPIYSLPPLPPIARESYGQAPHRAHDAPPTPVHRDDQASSALNQARPQESPIPSAPARERPRHSVQTARQPLPTAPAPSIEAGGAPGLCPSESGLQPWTSPSDTANPDLLVAAGPAQEEPGAPNSAWT